MKSPDDPETLSNEPMPSDRPLLSPNDRVDAKDLEVIRSQLGRLQYTPRQVLSRCPAGFPQVVLSFSGEGPGASTNILWLTCPHLRKQIDRLEGTGSIRRIEDSIAADPVSRDRLAGDQTAYARMVETLVTDLSPDEPHPLTRHGIGGVGNPTHLKCLHAHTAFFMTRGSGIVGDLVFAQLEENCSRDRIELCPEERCPGLE